MSHLGPKTLTGLAPNVRIPNYQRGSLTQGIVHIGVGNFHRAHEALVIDDLLDQDPTRPWAICGVALLPTDEPLARRMQAQEGLYTLIEKYPNGTWDARIIGSITEVLFAPDSPEAVLAKLCEPNIKVVSLTITEGGYNFDPITGEFITHAPAIQSDLVDASPTTVFGVITEALRRRREAGTPPFTVMSCDNIQHNGAVAKRSFTAFAQLKDAELGEWIAANVAFPNSMVDRITPVTTAEDIEKIAELIGVKDECPVVCEPFFQWVLEDNFPQGRPPLHEARVQIVDDVSPYEKMKLRLLNASHQGLAYFGHLEGYHYVHDAAQDANTATFLRRYMDEEATPTLDPVPEVDLDAYQSELIERFQNPEVKDTIPRLCAESSDRIPKWLVPVINDLLDQGKKVDLSAAIVASWARYAEGTDEHGQQIDVIDPLKDELIPRAQSQHAHPTAFIENTKLFGNLAEQPAFREPYLAALKHLHEDGARATHAWLVTTNEEHTP
jgi:mannitol 2-dehydrogenase